MSTVTENHHVCHSFWLLHFFSVSITYKPSVYLPFSPLSSCWKSFHIYTHRKPPSPPTTTTWLTRWSPVWRQTVHWSRRSQRYGAKVSKQSQPFPSSGEHKCPESKVDYSKKNIIDSVIIVILPATQICAPKLTNRGKVVLEFSHISPLQSKSSNVDQYTTKRVIIP